jgi:N-acetylmuramoyl-L-alanine amidase
MDNHLLPLIAILFLVIILWLRKYRGVILMMNNIKNAWTKMQTKIYQLYNEIKKRMPAHMQISALANKIPALGRTKTIYAALAMAMMTGVFFTGLAYTGKVMAEKSPARLSEAKKNEVKDKGGDSGKISSSDRHLLAKVIEGEAANEPLKGKVAVGAVILNRTESKDFPHDISQVVYQPLAFEAVANGQYNRPLTPEALKAADLAVDGWDPTNGALYYWNPAKASSKWIWQRPVTMQIGRHVFAM